jgi:hypothetical protein
VDYIDQLPLQRNRTARIAFLRDFPLPHKPAPPKKTPQAITMTRGVID